MQAAGAVFAGEEPEEDDFEEETPDQEVQTSTLTYQGTQPTSTATVLQGEEAEEDEASIDEGIFLISPFVYSFSFLFVKINLQLLLNLKLFQKHKLLLLTISQIKVNSLHHYHNLVQYLRFCRIRNA